MTTTRKALIVAAALLGLAAEATAQTVVHTRTQRTPAGWSSTTVVGRPYQQPDARIINLREEGGVSREARDAWVARCQPTLVRDRYGVGRWTYAEKGCEYGP